MIPSRQTMMRFLAVGAIALAVLAVGAPGSAQEPGPQPLDADAAAALVPDVAIVVGGVDAEARATLVQRLGAIGGVSRVSADQASDDRTVLYLTGAVGGGARPLDAVTGEARRVVTEVVPGQEVLIGGSAVVDQALDGHFATTGRWLVALAAALGAGAGAVFGWRRGLLVAVSLALATYCGGNIASQLGGGFDGTIGTTTVPGALAGLVMATALAVRLLVWFRHPRGGDGAEVVRSAIADFLPELGLLVTGLVSAAVVVELLDAGPSPVTGVAAGAAVAAVVLLAVLAPGLTLLPPEPEPLPGALPARIPDGGNLPLLVVVSVGALLAAVAALALRSPATGLIDAEQLGDDAEPTRVAEILSVSGGDATTALVAIKPPAASDVDFDGWVGAIAERSEVERAETAASRYLATGPVETPTDALLLDPGTAGAALVVLAPDARSADGQEVAARLTAMPLAGGQPQFAGRSVDAVGAASSTAAVVVAVLILALTAAAAMYAVTENSAQAAVAFGLRLVGGGAAAGLYRLMVGDALVAEVIVVVAVMAVAAGLYQLEFVQGRPGPAIDGTAAAGSEPTRGQYAMVATLALAAGGLLMALVSLFGGGAHTGRLGLGIAAVALVELVTGMWLLGPALLGQRAAFHTAVRPVRIAMHSGGEPRSASGAATDDPIWRRIVADLIQAEFRLQSQPQSAGLDLVFVPDTPLYRQAEAHHASLAGAGLRIVGRSPRLCSLKTLSGRGSVTLAVTVDHPERQLVDGRGTVVGVRRPERRSGVLWLSGDADGTYRIAESVELGTVPLPEEDEPAPTGHPVADRAGLSQPMAG